MSQREITQHAVYHYENAWQWYFKKDMFISSFMKVNAVYFLSEKYKEWEGRAVEKVWTAKSWNQTNKILIFPRYISKCEIREG